MMQNPFRTDFSWQTLAGLALAIVSCLCSAETNRGTAWYDFEVIIFERISAGAGGTEAWPEDPGKPSGLNAIPLLSTRTLSETEANQPHAYTQLPKSAWQLTEHEARLRRSRNYRPLLHLAWRQPMTEPELAQPLYLELAGKGTAAANWRDNAKLVGTLKVGLKRYLHLQADLLLRRQAGSEQIHSNSQAYRLQANRRMRSGELHYLDHPILGVLVLATRYEPPAPAESKPETTPPAQTQPSDEGESTPPPATPSGG